MRFIIKHVAVLLALGMSLVLLPETAYSMSTGGTNITHDTEDPLAITSVKKLGKIANLDIPKRSDIDSDTKLHRFNRNNIVAGNNSELFVSYYGKLGKYTPAVIKTGSNKMTEIDSVNSSSCCSGPQYSPVIDIDDPNGKVVYRRDTSLLYYVENATGKKRPVVDFSKAGFAVNPEMDKKVKQVLFSSAVVGNYDENVKVIYFTAGSGIFKLFLPRDMNKMKKAVFTTVAGSPDDIGFSGDAPIEQYKAVFGSTLTLSWAKEPSTRAPDGYGWSLYVADPENNRVRRLTDPDFTGTVETVVGGGNVTILPGTEYNNPAQTKIDVRGLASSSAAFGSTTSGGNYIYSKDAIYLIKNGKISLLFGTSSGEGNWTRPEERLYDILSVYAKDNGDLVIADWDSPSFIDIKMMGKTSPPIN